MKLIPLTQGKFAMVDDADFEELSRHKWCVLRAARGFYAVRVVWGSRQKMIYMHRAIMGALPGQEVDHIDGNRLNNTRANLRIVDRAGQARGFQSKRIGASSEFRGVSWHTPYNKWRAAIKHEGRQYFLGYFTVEKERAAALVFDNKARELGWPESGLNFPKTN